MSCTLYFVLVLSGSILNQVQFFMWYYMMLSVVVVDVVTTVPELHLHCDGVLLLLMHLDSL